MPILLLALKNSPSALLMITVKTEYDFFDHLWMGKETGSQPCFSKQDMLFAVHRGGIPLLFVPLVESERVPGCAHISRIQ